MNMGLPGSKSLSRWLTLIGLLTAHCAGAEILQGRVVAIADGDTITVLDTERRQYKIGLAGIDAPESKQAFGQQSRQHLSDLVLGKDVKVEWRKHDQYGRIIGKVMVQPPDCPTCAPTLDAGLAQLGAGLAWWYREYRREQSLEDQGYYEYAEFDAKARRIGLWVDRTPVPPWEWRKRNQIVAQWLGTRGPTAGLSRRHGS